MCWPHLGNSSHRSKYDKKAQDVNEPFRSGATPLFLALEYQQEANTAGYIAGDIEVLFKVHASVTGKKLQYYLMAGMGCTQIIVQIKPSMASTSRTRSSATTSGMECSAAISAKERPSLM